MWEDVKDTTAPTPFPPHGGEWHLKKRREKFCEAVSARPCDPATVQGTRGRKMMLSVAVVIAAMVAGFVVGLFVDRLVPGVPNGHGTYEGTVISFVAFAFT